MKPKARLVVLMADDDLDDVSLVADALAESDIQADFRSVADGHDLIQYLHRRGFYAVPENAPEPDIILLDLNMPRKNGTEVLAEMKTTPYLRDIPVIILTTSDDERDHYRTQNLGADGYLTKPNRFESLVDMMNALKAIEQKPKQPKSA